MLQIIVNPASRSGKGILIWQEVETILIAKNIQYKVHLTKHQGDATQYATLCTTNLSTLTTLVVLGGDGTLNEVIQGIVDYENVTIGYIPTGSSNDFARSLSLPKKRQDIISHILERKNITPIDMGMVTYENRKRYFVVSSGIGFDAAVCAEANLSTLKNTLNKLGLGKLTYLGIALNQIIHAKAVSCKLYVDDKEPILFPKFLFIAAMVQPYEGGGFLFCPDAKYNDGLLDVCAVGDISKIKALCILPTAFFGKHERFKNVTIYRGKNIRIVTETPLFLHTDGEVDSKTCDATITCLPHKLKFIC